MRDMGAKVGRADPVKVAMAALADTSGSGVILMGPVGSGKTFILRAVVTALSRTQRLSSASTVVTTPPTQQALKQVLERVDHEGGGTGLGRRLIAGDDLDTWGRTGLRMLAEALDDGRVQLIGSTRTETLERVLGTFRPARSPTLVPLEPWTIADLRGHAHRVLEGPLDAFSGSRLIQFSGGSPLCLVEQLDWGLRTGGLRRRYETWSWECPLEVPPVTRARVWNYLCALPQAVLDVVVALAGVGPIPLEVMLRVYSEKCLEQAENLGLVSVNTPSSSTLVSLVRPLDRQVALAASPILRRRAVTDQLLRSWVGAPWTGGSEARLARFCIDTGVTIPARLTAVATARSAHLHDPDFALKLTSIDGDSPRSRNARAVALVDQLCFPEAVRLLDGAPTEADPDGDRAARVAMLSAMSDNTSKTAPRLSHTAKIYGLIADAWTGVRLHECYETGRSLLRSPLDFPQYERCLVATTSAAMQLGRVEEALNLSRQVDEEVRDRFSAGPKLTLLAVVAACHLMRGGIREALAVASSLSRMGAAESWPLAFAVGRLLSGRCALLQARPHLASRRLSESVAAVSDIRSGPNLQLVLESLALAYLNRGSLADSEVAQLEAAREGAGCAPQIVFALARLTRAEWLHLRGKSASALDVCRSVACDEGGAHRPLQTLLAFNLMSRVQGSPEAADAVTAAAERCDFALASIHARYAVSATAQNAAELVAVAEAYDDHGLTWLAAETAATALACAEEQRSAPVWAPLARRLVAQLGEVEPVSPPEWWGAERHRPAHLTAREREIAHAAILGGTSAQIALQLNLSRRTVENHLQHVYQKLGIRSRKDLKASFTPSRGGRAVGTPSTSWSHSGRGTMPPPLRTASTQDQP